MNIKFELIMIIEKLFLSVYKIAELWYITYGRNYGY